MPHRPSFAPAAAAEDPFAVVRWGVLVLALLFSAITILCLAMFATGAWKRVPDLSGESWVPFLVLGGLLVTAAGAILTSLRARRHIA